MSEEEEKEKNMALTEHLEELRNVLIWVLVFAATGTAIAWIWHEELTAMLVKPLTDLGLKPVILRPAEGFFASLKVAFFAGLVIASPAVFWKIWSFIVPALYPNERKWVYILLPFSVLLLVTGVVFSYYTVYPLAIRFLVTFGDFTPMLSISEYLSFAITFILPFGIVFQLPLIVIFLVRIGVVNHHFLAHYRRHALLLMFVMAAIFTPTPDVISQILMAGPMYILYEISILLARFIAPKKKEHAEEDSEAEEGSEESTDIERKE
ncbi:twin-arginine translocase subunit TatC [Heliorestis acidaminivorans]|uniref:Sec-independent protein translocase protein TatC n=1 Tax=Heliorestis acidaminivorans TaxID=553427 RepID=A0A6I0EW09_9FIRM|nr:twin-arginine translocase subunit TatC [Heliorestis acidaminivorans]KAB2954604.1 twin-arginine translocase subunit TatC [Heliorestis acidaminivorans]